MPRHCKNRNDREFVTNWERMEAGYCRSRSERLGTHTQLAFGVCPLSVKPAADPVATPYGHIYDKEAILQWLVTQKEDMKKLQSEKDEQDERATKRIKLDVEAAEKQELEDFEKQERGEAVLSMANNEVRDGEIQKVDRVAERAHCKWYTPMDAPNADKKVIGKVAKATRCPITGKKLKMKDLIKVDWDVHDEKKILEGGAPGMYMCAVTKKAITHQPVVLLKKCGKVIEESVYKDAVKKEMVCPVTNEKITKDDVLKLVSGATGFAAHNNVEVKGRFLVRSNWRIQQDRGGSLGAKSVFLPTAANGANAHGPVMDRGNYR